MLGFLSSRVEEGSVFCIRCPYQGCTNELFESDVRRMAPPTQGETTSVLSTRFAELRSRDFSLRATQIRDEQSTDFDMLKLLWSCSRLCPRCSVVIERSEGCSHMYCMCGHSFNWDAAPRPVGGKQKKYGQVIDLAQGAGLSLEEAERMGGSIKLWQKALKLMRIVECTLAEACEIHKSAASGDAKARALIREARQEARLERFGWMAFKGCAPHVCWRWFRRWLRHRLS